MAKPQKAQNSAKAAAKKRVVKVDASGEVRISATFNNIIISFTNKAGQVISWSSAGKMGFKGSKKNTPYAAQMAAADALPSGPCDQGRHRLDQDLRPRNQVRDHDGRRSQIPRRHRGWDGGRRDRLRRRGPGSQGTPREPLGQEAGR